MSASRHLKSSLLRKEKDEYPTSNIDTTSQQIYIDLVGHLDCHGYSEAVHCISYRTDSVEALVTYRQIIVSSVASASEETCCDDFLGHPDALVKSQLNPSTVVWHFSVEGVSCAQATICFQGDIVYSIYVLGVQYRRREGGQFGEDEKEMNLKEKVQSEASCLM